MNDDRDVWNRVRSLFDAVTRLAPEERSEFLDRECDDERLRAEIESLLAADEQHAEELESSPIRALNAENNSSTSLASDAIPGYKILKELHRGGQGVVYQAIQHSTKRRIALKVMLEGPFASSASKRRFEREIEFVGSLSHPGIVPIFDAGVAHGQYYYAMEYIRGKQLDEFVEDGELSVNDILSLVVKICSAVNHAHQKGVIHRDLKPSNIIVDKSNEPHVLDFGLAKVGGADFDDKGHSLLVSVTGQVMGTLTYMSPEQAAGQPDQVDMRSDVYALGIVLYELLAGQLPYDLDSSMAENLSTIQEAEPRRLTFRGRRINNETETIVRKALSKDKGRRYSTAGDFGDDIARYLRGDPIEAKRDSALYVLRKTMRRHLVTVAFLTSFVVLALISSVVSWSLYLSAQKARKAESIASADYRSERDRAETNLQASERNRYAAEMNHANLVIRSPVGVAYIDEFISDSEPSDDRVHLRGWEWYYLQSLRGLQGELAREPWPHERVWSVHWNPAGTLLASAGSDGKVRIWRMDRSQPVHELHDDGRALWTVRWSPDGSRLASAGDTGEVIIWNAEEDFEKRRLRRIASRIFTVCWSPDGKQLVSASDDHIVRIWDASPPFNIITWDYPERVGDVAWSPDGKQIAVIGASGIVKLRDPRMPDSWKEFKAHNRGTHGMRWGPHPNRFATSSGDATLRVWNIKNHEEFFVEELHVFEHREEVLRCAWSPDGNRLGSTGRDANVYVWNLHTNSIEQYFKGHTGSSNCADWHPDAALLASGGEDGVRVWKLTDSPHPPRRTIELNEPAADVHVRCVAWDPQGEKLATVFSNNYYSVDCWDIATQTKDFSLSMFANMVAWSPDGTKLGVAREDGHLEVYDRVGNQLERIPADLGKYGWLAWNPNGAQLATANASGTIVRIWNTTSWEPIRKISAGAANDGWWGREPGLQSVDWSADGTRLLFAGGGTIRIWDVATWIELRTLAPHLSQATCVKWSPDGTQLVAAGADGQATIWDAATGEVVRNLPGHKDQLQSVRWSPDGTRLMTGSKDGTLQLWDVETERSVFTLMEGRHLSSDWSPDGKKIVAGTNDSRIHIWDATVGYKQRTERPSPR